MEPRLPLAFYAPLKPPTHANPSGDRQIAQRLMHSLGQAGFAVTLASRFRSYDRDGDAARQRRLQHLGERLAQRLIHRYRRAPAQARPRLWLTYHLYHKAPDWIGPRVCEALSIPYVVAEASYAAKQQQGPWQLGLEASRTALQQAQLILHLNPVDQAGIEQLAPQARQLYLPPYLDLTPYLKPATLSRTQLARIYGLDADRPWLISVAMMRPGDKAHSYRLLADSLRLSQHPNREVLLVGDGRAEAEVRAAFADLPRIHWLGRLQPAALIPVLQAADLLVWPAVNEAFGMAFLEAQAAATWVLAGNEGGVSSVVAAEHSGTLVAPRDPQALTKALDQLLSDRPQLQVLGRQARDWCQQHHAEALAVDHLRQALHDLLDPGAALLSSPPD